MAASHHIQYCNYNCVLVINSYGKLKQVFTPFRVVGITEGKRQWYIVEEVRNTDQDELLYIIGGHCYLHHHFTIEIQF